jgi:hypothetical protein
MEPILSSSGRYADALACNQISSENHGRIVQRDQRRKHRSLREALPTLQFGAHLAVEIDPADVGLTADKLYSSWNSCGVPTLSKLAAPSPIC